LAAFDLLAVSALASASPAIARDETTAGDESGLVARAGQWVASHMPGGTDAARSGSPWWTSEVVESEAPTGVISPLASQTAVHAEATSVPGTGAVSSGNGGFGAPANADVAARANAKSRVENGAGTAAGSSSDVPEPGMLGLFAAGSIALALRRLAKRKAAS
jgi:hypothetical protein